MARVAITGAAGQLGRQLVAAFEAAGHEVRGLTHADFDITAGTGADALRAWRPEVVVNSAAWTDVDGCARDPDRALRVNGEGAGRVADVAAEAGALVVQISTNEVFDGAAERPYRPDDPPSPINAYGSSKLAGERAVAAATPRHLIVRTAWLFGPGGTNFVTKILAAGDRAREAGSALRLVDDEVGNPTWTPDLAAAILHLVSVGVRGIVHAAGEPPTSRLGWGRVALDAAGLDVPIEPVSLASFERPSTPPLRAVLEPTPGLPPMTWEPIARAYVEQLVSAGRA
jgi:dTDP-4-dehydrorhamnose reductase